MFEKAFLNFRRIICSSAMRASVLMFTLSPCGATDIPSPLSDLDCVMPNSPEFVEGLAAPSGICDLAPDPLNSTPAILKSYRPVEKGRRQGVDWSGIILQSVSFLAVEQGFRLATQPGTREALKGKFFDDWFKSVKSTKGWGDGDDFLTNYIGHPMEGSVVANIFVHNDPGGCNQVFGRDSGYWNSRFKATIWSALYSTQFELGPFSEASVGNVGYHDNSLSGAVDLVVTPLVGLGWQVGEDALDKYLIAKIETWTTNPVLLMFARSVLNPTRSFANAMRMAVPWSRDTRPGIWRSRRNNR